MTEHPTFIRRLNWKFGSRVPMDSIQVAESIARAPHEAVWFIDNNVIADDVDAAIVEALLAVPGRMVLTPLVMQEMQPWLMRHPEHPLSKAMKSGQAQPGEWRPPEKGERGHDAYEYYLALLVIRRNSITAAELAFHKEHGREPDETERETIRTEVQREVSPRGFMLAKKGSSNLPTDEALVYLAVHHALTTGRPTQILTADADVEEQFVKLVWLVNTQYRGMLIAKRYVADLASFRPRPFPEPFWSKAGDTLFERKGAVLIERGDPSLQQYLPGAPRCVAVSCWRIGAYFSAQTFMAEEEMAELLEVKDRTGGLSTDLLGGRNLHPWLGLLPLTHEDAMAAAVVRDQRLPLPFTNVKVPKLDVLLTMGNFESRIHVEGSLRDRVQIDSRDGTPVVYEDLIGPPTLGDRRTRAFPSR
ncbi:MAG TPA: hypothetical protein VGN13_03005 [Solirubrobacteraceae bacterium]